MMLIAQDGVEDSVDAEAVGADEGAVQEEEADRQLRHRGHPRAGGADEEAHAGVDRGREGAGHWQPGKWGFKTWHLTRHANPSL